MCPMALLTNLCDLLDAVQFVDVFVEVRAVTTTTPGHKIVRLVETFVLCDN